MKAASARHFLFLQGPHGPLFRQLAARLETVGVRCSRVAFNAGDAAMWGGRPGLLPFQGGVEAWADAVPAILAREGVSDLVLYGETRPLHAAAIRAARAAGVRLHLLEEGYLRPWWITYERTGTNARSPVVSMPVAAMRAALGHLGEEPRLPPARWGDMREHMFWGAVYHARLLAGRRRFPNYRSHRRPDVTGELRLHLLRLGTTPLRVLARRRAERRIRHRGLPYHLVLLQLEHDASFRDHSDHASQADFVEEVVAAFAAAAPDHQHLVFKAHPLEDGRVPLRRVIRTAARRAGIGPRVHLVPGGPLAPLLDGALGVVTVNSTAVQQALWRGLPVAATGRAVYSRPELVSGRPLEAFFAAPRPPDAEAYRIFRSYLLHTCQIPGGFYAARARRRLIPRLLEAMLHPCDPHARLSGCTAPGHARG